MHYLYVPNLMIMKPTNENQTTRNTNPSNVSQNPPHKRSVQETDEDQAATNVDLDKANFADRKHGRTNDSLGPDHEPGTV